jgi:glucose/arabinose dehydrogenase
MKANQNLRLASMLCNYGKAATLFLSLLILIPSCQKEIKDKITATQDESMQDRNGTSRNDGNEDAVDIKLVAENLTSPLGVVFPEDNSKRLFIIDQIGKIWVLDKDGNLLPEPFLDISSNLVPLNPNGDERGLLGLAFHPDYKHNGRFYVYYQARPRPGGPTPVTLWNNLSRVVEYKVSPTNENKADPNSARAVLELDDAQGNHNGGTIAFGPKDGYLYIAIGDGGGANDVGVNHVTDWYLTNAGGNGQDLDSNLFGNILRLDIDGGLPYGVPADNPFVGKPGKDEIYAYGLRNPYRFSFDSKQNHDLIVGDVGQLMYEEINVVQKGANLGWNVKEGYSCFNAASSQTPFPTCPTVDNLGTPLTDPVIVMNNVRNPAGGRTIAIIGGNVYRGSDLSHHKGKYIFGTYTQAPGQFNAELFIAQPRSSGPWSFQELAVKSRPNDLGMLLKGFGEDRHGELYLTTSSRFGPTGNTGKVYKLVEADDD